MTSGLLLPTLRLLCVCKLYAVGPLRHRPIGAKIHFDGNAAVAAQELLARLENTLQISIGVS